MVEMLFDPSIGDICVWTIPARVGAAYDDRVELSADFTATILSAGLGGPV